MLGALAAPPSPPVLRENIRLATGGSPRGDAGMDETCDAYSYGVMLWECVTGRVPWEWMANHLQVIFAVAVEGSRLPLPDASESCGVTEELRDLVLECWKEEPDSRPRFKDVVQRVEAMRRHLGRL